MGYALNRLALEDPTFKVKTEEETGDVSFRNVELLWKSLWTG